jgi:glycosyltransferase involved in cell wall biosynthesis
MPEIINSLPEELFLVFVIRPPKEGQFNVYNGLPVSVSYGTDNNLRAAVSLWRFAVRNRSAVFHGLNIGPFFLFIIRMAGIRKAVYSIRGTHHASGYFQRLIRKAAWRMAVAPGYRILANSEYSRDLFLDFLSPQKPSVSVLYNPVSSSRITATETGRAKNGLHIVYTGRLAEGKNMVLWLEMAESIHRAREDAKFYIYGDGLLKESLLRQSAAKGMQDYLFFMGFTADLSEAYTRADLMLFLSERESFGNAVVESILFGIPVIALDIPSVREIFRNFPQFLIRQGQSMESEILGKINQIDQLRRLVPEAAKEFRERFSMEQHSARLRTVYGGFGAD